MCFCTVKEAKIRLICTVIHGTYFSQNINISNADANVPKNAPMLRISDIRCVHRPIIINNETSPCHLPVHQ